MQMDHANIIRLHEVYESANELYLVMDCCAGGELFDRIKEQPDGNYSEVDAAQVLRQACEGLKYMHAHKIAHCDLKPDNFLFASPDKNAALKIIDFGKCDMRQRPKYLGIMEEEEEEGAEGAAAEEGNVTSVVNFGNCSWVGVIC